MDNKNKTIKNRKEWKIMKQKIKKHIISTTFCLPITYVDKDKLHEIDAHVMTDLELIHVQSDLEKEDEKEKEKEKVKRKKKITLS